MADDRTRSQLSWYVQQAPMTSLGEHGALARGRDVAALVGTVQHCLIHPFHAHRYGVQPDADCERQLQNRSVRAMLAELGSIDPSAAESRPPAERAFGNCRHFATLMTGLLRERGIPARSRCGFGAYFTPGKWEDHWVTEMWNEDESRWQLVDAQIDEIQRTGMGIRVDTSDLGREDFWVAGQAWLRCRQGRANADDFGLLDMWGLWFVHDNLVRDVASLCKVELLPWDAWGAMARPLEEKSAEELALLDHAAELTSAVVPDVAAIRALYEDDAFRVPSTILSFRPTPGPVELGALASP